MKKAITIILMLSLIGCTIVENDSIANYKCSAEQLRMVNDDMDICLTTGYLASFCFLSAKSLYCDDVRANNKAVK